MGERRERRKRGALVEGVFRGRKGEGRRGGNDCCFSPFLEKSGGCLLATEATWTERERWKGRERGSSLHSSCALGLDGNSFTLSPIAGHGPLEL